MHGSPQLAGSPGVTRSVGAMPLACGGFRFIEEFQDAETLAAICRRSFRSIATPCIGARPLAESAGAVCREPAACYEPPHHGAISHRENGGHRHRCLTLATLCLEHLRRGCLVSGRKECAGRHSEIIRCLPSRPTSRCRFRRSSAAATWSGSQDLHARCTTLGCRGRRHMVALGWRYRMHESERAHTLGMRCHRMARCFVAQDSDADAGRRRLNRGRRFLSKRCWDETLQTHPGSESEMPWQLTAQDRTLWCRLESPFVTRAQGKTHPIVLACGRHMMAM